MAALLVIGIIVFVIASLLLVLAVVLIYEAIRAFGGELLPDGDDLSEDSSPVRA